MHRRIMLTQGKYALVDQEDYDYLSHFNWCYNKGTKNKSGYALRATRTKGKYKRIYMHRVIVQALPGEVVDHINHDTLDNRRENLRIGSQKLNLLNRYPNTSGTSPYKGVSFFKGSTQWVAVFKRNHLGYYDTEVEAALAYNAAAHAENPDWILLNQIPGLSLEESIKPPRPPRAKRNRYRGVRFRGKSWEAYIQVNKVRHVIGYFPYEVEAAKAYNETCYKFQLPKRKNKNLTPMFPQS